MKGAELENNLWHLKGKKISFELCLDVYENTPFGPMAHMAFGCCVVTIDDGFIDLLVEYVKDELVGNRKFKNVNYCDMELYRRWSSEEEEKDYKIYNG